MSYAVLMRWFHEQFADQVVQATWETVFSPDLVMSIALKETGSYIRRMLRDGLPTEAILLRCVGDTIERDADDEEEIAAGQRNAANQLWAVAREALELIAEYSSSYRRVSEARPDAYCRGFGIFQYDIQFYEADREFFLERRWQDFGECLRRFIRELNEAIGRNDWEDKPALTFGEQIGVAIAYNRGRYDPERGLRQGHQNNDTGRYYGEEMMDIMVEARTLGLDWTVAPSSPATKRRLIEVARSEWEAWGRSTWNLVSGQKRIGQTDEDPEIAQYIIDRYCVPVGARATIAQITGDAYAWSAVGMSYFFRKAGFTPEQFPFSQSHSTWIRKFIAAGQAGDDALYHGRRLSEGVPEVGDLVCYLREERDFEEAQSYFDVTQRYQSHSDIVVARRELEIDVIGANVSKSVTLKTIRLDRNGLIADRNFPWFAVLKARFN